MLTKNSDVMKFRTLQILGRIRDYPNAKREIMEDIGIRENDLDEIKEYLFESLVDSSFLVECGCCGSYHRHNYDGDCRNDLERIFV